MQLTTCPSSEQLSDYLSGKLSAQEIDEISLHIETCVDCDTAVNKLDDDSDSLMFALRQPLGEELFEQEPELQRAVAAMRLSLPESESQNSCTVLGTVREYDLLEKIGQGGMGTVYKALHSRLKRIVALKVLADHRLGDPAAVDRFSREMQAVGKLAHPNIVRALDAGEAEGRHYLVMEYIDGIDLSRLSRRCGPLPVAEASELVLQVSLALQHAHEHGLVHRDIKPSNVMLTRDGNVKLLDLGIALLQPDEPATSDLTGTGQVMGTLDYMAPEQLDNTHAVDIRADVYGLGATLYKLLCGSAPATDSQSRFRLPGESIPPVPNIRTIRGDIPKPVAAVIQRMLAPNPDQRYDTPADVAEALKPFAAKSNLKQLALAAAADAPSRTMTPPKRFGGRLGRFVIVAAALLGMTLAGFAIYIETDKGQIVIHSNVDDIQVLVKRTGKLYDALDELEVGKGDNQWKFRSGSYEVQLLGNTDGLRVKDGVFTLTRDGKAVVKIERDPARAKAVVSGPVYEGKTFDDWVRQLKTDKSPLRQIEGIKALVALGTAENAEQALAIILEIGSNHRMTGIGNVEPEVRDAAGQAFKQFDREKATSLLVDTLKSKDANKRMFALMTLQQFPVTDEVFPHIVKMVNDPDSSIRQYVPVVLFEAGERGIPELTRLLAEDKDPHVRSVAAFYLKSFGEKGRAALPQLLEAAVSESNSSQTRQSALEAIHKMHPSPKQVHDTLRKALQSKDVQVRRDATGIYGLHNLCKSEDAYPVLMMGLTDDDKQVRIAILNYAQFFMNETEAVNAAAIAILRDHPQRPISELLTHLSKHGKAAKRMVPSLIQRYKTSNNNVEKMSLLYSFGNIGPDAKAALPIIESAIDSDDEKIRKAAETALPRVQGKANPTPPPSSKVDPKSQGAVYDGKTFDEWVTLLKTDKSPQRQIEGIKALVALGTAENASRALEIVFEMGASHSIERQNDDDRDVVSAALEAIARIDDAKLVRPFLLGKLDSEDAGARLFAITVLNYPLASGRDPNYSEKTLARIYAMSGDPAVRVRMKLIELLGRLARADKSPVPTLIKMYETDKDQQVRYAAFHSLAALGDKRAHAAFPLFLAGISSSDSIIRGYAWHGFKSTQSDPEQLNKALLKALESDDENVRRDVMKFLDNRLRFPQESPELLPVVIAVIETRPLENKGRNRLRTRGDHIRLEEFDKFPKEVTIAIVRKLESAEEPDRERWHSAMVSFSNGLGGFPASALIVDELVHLYQDADVSRRIAILQLLGALRANVKPATALYETALKDKDPQVRAAAEAALKAMRSKSRKTDSPPVPKTSGAVYDGKTFEEWVTLLKTDRSAHRQLEGIKALASLRSDENTPLVVSTIIKIAGDGDRISTGKNDPNVAESAEAILGQIGQAAAVPQLLAALESEDVSMRHFAVRAITRFAITNEMTPAILKLINDPDESIRGSAVYPLAAAGDPGIEALIKIIKSDSSSRVRARAIQQLEHLGEKARPAVPALLEALLAKDDQLREAAIYALKELKPDQDVLNSVLLNFVAADLPVVINNRSVNPFMLVDTNSPATIPALIAAITDDDETLRNEAWQILFKYHDDLELVIPALIAALENEKLEHKETIVSLLTIYAERAKAAIPALIKLYKTSDNKERRKLLAAYEKIDLQHKDVQPLLHQAAQSEDQNLSRAAQKLLQVDAEGTDVAAVSLTIKVTADGKLSIGDKPYDLQALKTLLAEQIKQAGERGVAVRIDAAAEVRFDAVNTLIEMCKKAGVRNVSLGTTKVAPAAKNDGAAVYDGKTFDEWISILKTETNPAKLAPVITAVGATGARGREREATEAILNVAKLMIAPFNESLYSNEDEKKLGELYNAINIALTRIGAPHATDALIEAVNAPHLGMRRHAQQVLYEWTMSEEHADQIFAALKHNDPEMQEWAVAQLAKIADSGVRKFDEIVAQLFEIISNDKSLAMRRAAAQELRRLIGNPNTGDRRAQIDRFKARRIKEVDGALEQLYSLAKDQDPTIRFCVLWVLTRIEADPATLIPLLADAAGDKKSATQQLVIDELSNLAPRLPTAIAALIASYPRFGADERIRVVNAFGHKGTIAAPAIPLLKEAAKSDDQLLREAAVEALKKLEPSKQ